jgi:hypothetical protein
LHRLQEKQLQLDDYERIQEQIKLMHVSEELPLLASGKQVNCNHE